MEQADAFPAAGRSVLEVPDTLLQECAVRIYEELESMRDEACAGEDNEIREVIMQVSSIPNCALCTGFVLIDSMRYLPICRMITAMVTTCIVITCVGDIAVNTLIVTQRGRKTWRMFLEELRLANQLETQGRAVSDGS
jgi:hypothetical protein